MFVAPFDVEGTVLLRALTLTVLASVSLNVYQLVFRVPFDKFLAVSPSPSSMSEPTRPENPTTETESGVSKAEGSKCQASETVQLEEWKIQADAFKNEGILRNWWNCIRYPIVCGWRHDGS